MSLTKKVALNTIIQIIGKVITTAISLVLIASITRYLGVSGYGQYTTIFAFVSFWAVLADFGFYWILVREISKPESDVEKVFNNIITLRSVVGLLVFVLCFIVALFIPTYSMIIKLGIGACAAGWFWMSINSTYVGVFQSNLKMQYSVIGDIVGRSVILWLVLFFISRKFNLNLIIWAYFAGNIINFLVSYLFGRKFVHFRLTFDVVYWKKIFVETLPMGIVLILAILYFKADTVMLSLFKSNTDVGIYGAPFKILETLQLLPTMFMGNVFPIITRYLQQNDERFDSAFQKSFDFLSITAAPIVAGTLATATLIINFIAGQDFVRATTLKPILGLTANAPLVLQILIITLGLFFISQLFSNTVIAMGKQRDLVKPYLLFAAVNIGLNLILIPWISYLGAAISTVITGIVVLAYTQKIVAKYHPLKISYGVLFKAILAAIIMAMAILVMKSGLVMSILAGIIVYILVLFLLGGISKDLIKSVVKG